MANKLAKNINAQNTEIPLANMDSAPELESTS